MAEAYRPDGQLNIPTQAAADEMNTPEGRAAFEQAIAQGRGRVENREWNDKWRRYLEVQLGENLPNDEPVLSLGPTEMSQGTKGMTPTRDAASKFIAKSIYGDDYDADDYKKVTNFMGGEGQGFLEMGYSDVTPVPAFFDSYDAYKRLQETKKNDNYSDGQEKFIENMPLWMKMAGLGAGAMGTENAVSDYYDGKKSDIATMYGGPLGLVGITAGAAALLTRLGRKATDAPVIGKFLNKLSPKVGELGALPK
mgnify:FL=1